MTISSSAHNQPSSSKSSQEEKEELRLLEKETTKECEEIIQNKIISCHAIQVIKFEIFDLKEDLISHKYQQSFTFSYHLSTIIYLFFISIFNFVLVSLISFKISKSNKNIYQIFIYKSC